MGAPMDDQTTNTIPRKVANHVISAGFRKAAALDTPVAITISDGDGHPISQQRMTDASPQTFKQAQNMAATAARQKASSEKLGDPGTPGGVLQRHLAEDGPPLFAGGLPLTQNETVIGAIGVGGGAAESRQTIAQAGVDRFEENYASQRTNTERRPSG